MERARLTLVFLFFVHLWGSLRWNCEKSPGPFIVVTLSWVCRWPWVLTISATCRPNKAVPKWLRLRVDFPERSDTFSRHHHGSGWDDLSQRAKKIRRPGSSGPSVAIAISISSVRKIFTRTHLGAEWGGGRPDSRRYPRPASDLRSLFAAPITTS